MRLKLVSAVMLASFLVSVFSTATSVSASEVMDTEDAFVQWSDILALASVPSVGLDDITALALGSDLKDLDWVRIISSAFGSAPGDPNWDPIADINQDGFVDILDLDIVSLAFRSAQEDADWVGIVSSALGSELGDPNWDPIADINQDGFVDILDLVIVTFIFPPARIERFPVGIIADSLFGANGIEIPLMVYYPALENGNGTEPNDMYTYAAIVFSHGFMAAGMYNYMCNLTASQGYVVVAPSVSTMNPLQILPQAEEAVTASIDYIFSGICSDVGNVVDTAKIGVAGHSLGAMSVLGAAYEDTRIKAVVSMCPFYDEMIESIGVSIGLMKDYVSACRGITAPTQIIAASEDSICTPNSIKTSYYQALMGTKEFLVINGSGHTLGLIDMEQTNTTSYGNSPGMTEGFVGTEDHRDIALRYLIHWFDCFLYGDIGASEHLFGADTQKDLDEGLLAQIIYQHG